MELGNWQKLARNATSYIASANLLCIYLYYYARHICTFNMKHILGVNCVFFLGFFKENLSNFKKCASLNFVDKKKTCFSLVLIGR